MQQGRFVFAEDRIGQCLDAPDYSGRTLIRCSFRNARLNGGSFRGAHLYDCDFRGVELYGVDFTGAEFQLDSPEASEVGLPDEMWLTKPPVVPEWGCSPSRVHLACIEGCVFDGADLRGIEGNGVQFQDCRFAGATLDGAELRGTRFSGCDLSEVDLRLGGAVGTKFDVCTAVRAPKLAHDQFGNGISMSTSARLFGCARTLVATMSGLWRRRTAPDLGPLDED